MNKKILILYTSVGLGHKVIAENIGYHLERSGYEVKLLDVLQLQAGALVSISTAIHQGINKYFPFVWKWLYIHSHRGWFHKLTAGNRVRVASKNYQHVKQVVDDFRPDLVITTQTTASAVMQYLKQQGWYTGLFAITFSDYHLHSFWLYEAADFYLVNIDEQKQEMVTDWGISSDKIFVIGTTLRPASQIDAPAVKQKLRIKPEEKILLIASGSLGIGLSARWYWEFANQLGEHPLPIRLIIVCGKNQALKQVLDTTIKNPRVIIFGYYSPLQELDAISNLFLTKPGGLTTAETFQLGLPLLITHWLPGQEEPNYHYLLEKQLILPRPANMQPQAVWEIALKELSTGNFRESLQSNPVRLQLTQSGHEGQVLQEAINQAFHRFDRPGSSQ